MLNIPRKRGDREEILIKENILASIRFGRLFMLFHDRYLPYLLRFNTEEELFEKMQKLIMTRYNNKVKNNK